MTEVAPIIAAGGELVVASGNAGKVAELQKLFTPLAVTLRLQSELKVVPAEETGTSFVENALLKARAAAQQTGLPALADDSGLAVDALDGAPGVRSARYGADGGFAADDEGNNSRLLQALRDVPDAQRSARFHCVLVLMRHGDDPAPLIAEGRWEGRILDSARGDGGFGYDPLFFVPERQCSAAELSREDKNQLSHRGMASRRLLELLQSA
jgi:XTP/dITP diphosphohydrolase